MTRDKPSNKLHVVPLGDYREHEASADCWCRPTPDTENEDVIKHHALDGREKYETGELKLH